jgi:calcium-dependent protein kinase
MAPEIVKKIDYDAKATDIWAIGILAYRMLYGVPPFRAPSEKELYSKISKGLYSFPQELRSEDQPSLKIDVSSSVKDFITSMLKYKPEERGEAASYLSHEWMKEGGWLLNGKVIEIL